MKCKVCPVCGRFEDIKTEYCSECNAKTVDFDDGMDIPGTESEKESAWEETNIGRGNSGKVFGGFKGKLLGVMGILAVLVIVALVFANRDLTDSERISDSNSAMGSSLAQSSSADDISFSRAEDGLLPESRKEPMDKLEESDSGEDDVKRAENETEEINSDVEAGNGGSGTGASGTGISDGIETGDLMVTAKVVTSWESGGATYFQYDLTLSNETDTRQDGRTIRLTFSSDITLQNSWNGNYEVDGNVLTISSMDYNAKIEKGGSVDDVGFVIQTDADCTLGN